MVKKMKKFKPRKAFVAQPVEAGGMALVKWAGMGLAAGEILAFALLGLAALILGICQADMSHSGLWAQIIKVLAAIAAAVLATYKGGPMTWLRGLAVGALTLAVAYWLMGLFGAQTSGSPAWLADLGLGAVTGLAGSILVALLRR
jgi:hypothetical protein